MVITLGPELEAALSAVAHRHGIAPEALAIKALRQQFVGMSLPVQPNDEWERRLFGAAIESGVSVSDSALGRDELHE